MSYFSFIRWLIIEILQIVIDYLTLSRRVTHYRVIGNLKLMNTPLCIQYQVTFLKYFLEILKLSPPDLECSLLDTTYVVLSYSKRYWNIDHYARNTVETFPHNTEEILKNW